MGSILGNGSALLQRHAVYSWSQSYSLPDLANLLTLHRDLTNEHSPSELRVYATGDGPDVYEDAFMKVAKSDAKFNPTLILVGTRLGLEKITPVYWEALKHTLQMPQSIGIAG